MDWSRSHWALMYRIGLGRSRIAALVRAAPATVGYHLGIARRREPDLEPAHLAERENEGPPGSVLNASPASASRACSRTDLDTVAGALHLAGRISSLANNWQRNRCEVVFSTVGECDQKSPV